VEFIFIKVCSASLSWRATRMGLQDVAPFILHCRYHRGCNRAALSSAVAGNFKIAPPTGTGEMIFYAFDRQLLSQTLVPPQNQG
jgi:hypothetical protein